MEEENKPNVLNFSSHMAAAKDGCPVCKKPMKDLMAEKRDGVWRNRCEGSGCTGVMFYKVSYETAVEAAAKIAERKGTRGPSPAKENSPPVCEDWDYIANLYEWMTVEGKVVPIRKLPEKEFVDSVWAIIHANFAKVGSRMAWAKLLPTFGPAYAYPKEPLGVGAADAKEKLEEFYENAVERGWVTPERE